MEDLSKLVGIHRNDPQMNVVLIAYTHLRTPKYMDALAMNIPRLSHRWLDACLDAVSSPTLLGPRWLVLIMKLCKVLSLSLTWYNWLYVWLCYENRANCCLIITTDSQPDSRESWVPLCPMNPLTIAAFLMACGSDSAVAT